jgi:hypothetical protein
MSKHPKRPRDPNVLAKHIIDIATGEVTEERVDEKRSKAGMKGAKARMRYLSPERRSEIASIAAEARWKKT